MDVNNNNKNDMLSPHFSLLEMTKTNSGLVNVPNEQQIRNLTTLCREVLEPVRGLLGVMNVDSGYRCPAVNKAAKGQKNSQHLSGQAADIRCYDNSKLFYTILKFFPFDQLIWEFGDNDQPAWVHVSYNEGSNRKQVLRATKVNGKKKYEDVTKILLRR